MTVLLYYLLVKGEVHVLSHSSRMYGSYSNQHELLYYQIFMVFLTVYSKHPWETHHTESCPYMDLFGNQLYIAQSLGFDVLYVTKILCMEHDAWSSLNSSFPPSLSKQYRQYFHCQSPSYSTSLGLYTWSGINIFFD